MINSFIHLAKENFDIFLCKFTNKRHEILDNSKFNINEIHNLHMYQIPKFLI